MLNNILAVLGDGGGAINSYESIATVTVGALGAANVTFSSIPSTYKHLQIRGIVRELTGGFDQAFMQFNSDTGTNYATHNLNGNGSSAGAGATTTTSSMSVAAIPGVNQSANVFGGTVIDILLYLNSLHLLLPYPTPIMSHQGIHLISFSLLGFYLGFHQSLTSRKNFPSVFLPI